MDNEAETLKGVASGTKRDAGKERRARGKRFVWLIIRSPPILRIKFTKAQGEMTGKETLRT